MNPDTPHCSFCQKPVPTGGGGNGGHHIIPKEVLEAMGWMNSPNILQLLNRTIPICKDCHEVLTALEQPLIYLIREFREKPRAAGELCILQQAAHTVVIRLRESIRINAHLMSKDFILDKKPRRKRK